MPATHTHRHLWRGELVLATRDSGLSMSGVENAASFDIAAIGSSGVTGAKEMMAAGGGANEIAAGTGKEMFDGSALDGGKCTSSRSVAGACAAGGSSLALDNGVRSVGRISTNAVAEISGFAWEDTRAVSAKAADPADSGTGVGVFASAGGDGIGSTSGRPSGAWLTWVEKTFAAALSSHC